MTDPEMTLRKLGVSIFWMCIFALLAMGSLGAIVVAVMHIFQANVALFFIWLAVAAACGGTLMGMFVEALRSNL